MPRRHYEKLSERPFEYKPRRRHQLKGADPELQISLKELFEWIFLVARPAAVAEDVLSHRATITAKDLGKRMNCKELAIAGKDVELFRQEDSQVEETLHESAITCKNQRDVDARHQRTSCPPRDASVA